MNWPVLVLASVYIGGVGGVWGYALADGRWKLALGCVLAIVIPFLVLLGIAVFR